MMSHPFRRVCLIAATLVIGAVWPRFGSAQSEVTGAQIETTISALSPFGQVGGLAYDGSTNRLYVRELGSSLVRVIDPDGGVLVDTLQVLGGGGDDYRLFAIDTARRRIYAGFNLVVVNVYDAQTGAQVDSWSAPAEFGPGVLALNPANGFLYHNNGGLTVFDPTKPSGGPGFLNFDALPSRSVAVDPSTNFVYLAGIYGCGPATGCLKLVIVDGRPESPSFHTVLINLMTSLSGGQGDPWGTRIAIDRARNRVFVGDGQTIWTIDGTPGSPTFSQVVATTVVTADPQLGIDDLAVNPITSRVYVKLSTRSDLSASSFAGRLVTLDANSNAVIGVMNLPGRHVGGWVAVDPSRDRVFVAPGLFGPPYGDSEILVISDPATTTAPVSAGTATVTPQATMQFNQVSSPGSITVERIEQSEMPAPLPGQFTVEGGLAYNITTTAGIDGPITICFNASHVTDPTTFAALRVLHGVNDAWVELSTLSRNFTTGYICAETPSLSPFVVVSLDVDYQVRELYDASRAVKAGSTIPLKIQLIALWGPNLSAADTIVTATGLNKVSDSASYAVQDAGQSNADSNFRFDATVGLGGGYVFNLQTKGLTTGTYELEFTATGDRAAHKLRFQVR